MPSKLETQRRKAILRDLRSKSRAAHEAKRVISPEDLVALFDHVGVALAAGCDHSLRFTRAFLESRALPVEVVVPWLGEYGGYCDCEVLANVENDWPDDLPPFLGPRATS